LTITGILFGSLIENQLVSYIPLGIALRYVLEGISNFILSPPAWFPLFNVFTLSLSLALRKPPGSKMFKFGVHALSQFKSRFGEWPQYFTHILQIPHLRQQHPDLYDMIDRALRSHSDLNTGLEEPMQATSLSSSTPEIYGQSRLPQSRLPLQSPPPGSEGLPARVQTSPNPNHPGTPLTSLNVNTVIFFFHSILYLLSS